MSTSGENSQATLPLLERETTFSRRTESVLRQMVLDGTLNPGERLNEVVLAQSLGISRGPLREAIQKLAGEGLLQVQSHRGAFVRTYEPRELIELYEMRAALELYAVRLAATRAPSAELEELQFLASAVENHGVERERGPYLVELDFHQQLVMLAHNSMMNTACLEINRRLYLALAHSDRDQQRATHAAGEHLDVAVALATRNVDSATELMEIHHKKSMQNTLAVLGLASN
jgi:DNA-binding GntR family transcriptional regulator